MIWSCVKTLASRLGYYLHPLLAFEHHLQSIGSNINRKVYLNPFFFAKRKISSAKSCLSSSQIEFPIALALSQK
jgi:hypothetical protein